MEPLGSAAGALTGERITVHKCGSDGREVTRYEGTVVAHDGCLLAIRALWARGTCDVGMFTLENGDSLLETYYFQRWWNAFEVRAAGGRLRGWYCNITRPARLAGRDLCWDDLALDLLIAPTGQILVADEDEFRALGLDEREPQAYAEALRAVAEIRALAARRSPPFAALEDGSGEGLTPAGSRE